MQDASPQAAVITPEAPRGLSLRGLIEVFYAPAKLFADLAVNPRVLVPYIVFGILILAVMWLMSDMIVEIQVASPQMQERLQAQGVQMTPQFRTILKYQTIIGGTLSYLLVPLIAAGLAMFLGNFVFSGQSRFKSILSVMLYSEVLWAVGSLIVAFISLSKGALTSPFSLSFLAPEADFQSATYVGLSKIEAFHIWELVVIGIGLSILYRVTRGKGFVMALLSMGVLSLIQVLFTLFMG